MLSIRHKPIPCPKFVIRPAKGRQIWSVFGVWQHNGSEEILHFDAKSKAQDWIETKSEAWLEQRCRRNTVPVAATVSIPAPDLPNSFRLLAARSNAPFNRLPGAGTPSVPIALSAEDRQRLEYAADARGTTSAALALSIVQVAVREGLIDAVLDDRATSNGRDARHGSSCGDRRS